jgi:type IV pilus biogenesis protein CpaD/CtpE
MRRQVSVMIVAAAALAGSWTAAFSGGADTNRTAAEKCQTDESSFDTVGFDGDNSFDKTVGCSVRTGIALMAANKRDLVKGQGTRFSDGERAANIVNDYRAWKGRPSAPHGQENH